MQNAIFARIVPTGRLLAAGLVVAGVAGLGAVTMSHGNARATGDTFEPIQAMSYVFGSKRMVGYFDRQDGKCRLTMMIAEAVDPDIAVPPSATRVSLALVPGQATSLDSAADASLALTCGSGARTVQVTHAPASRT